MDLTQLADADLFPTVARGLRLILANAVNLWRGASFAEKAGHTQGAVILAGFAEEEAAKFHILLDGIRCPRDKRFSEHLRHFYDHLARGIYARHYDARPADFEEVRRYVNAERLALYLDGPEGFEWIFRNQIIERREAQIYVDYVQPEENRHSWFCPMPILYLPPSVPTRVLAVARSLARAGFATTEGLKIVAELWRPFEINDSTHWGEVRDKNFETLKLLDERGFLKSSSNEVLDRVIDDWAFPLYGLTLTEDRSVSIGDLRRLRSEAEVKWMEREFG